MTSEQRYRNLIENIVDYVVEIDLDGTRTYVSPRVFDVIGYLPNELIGTVGYKSIHPEDLPNVIKTFESGLKSKEVLTVEYRIKHKNGHYLPVSAKGCVVDNSGKPKVVAVITNMTDKKETKLMFDTIADGVFILDRNYKFRIVNKAAADLVEVTVDQLVGNKITELFPGIEQTPFYKAYEYVMEKRKMQRVVDMFIFPDGRKGYYEVRVFPISEGILCIARNITEEKKTEQKLKESEEKLRLIFEGSYNLISITDSSAKPLWANPAWINMFGPVENYKVLPLQFTHPEDREKVTRLWNMFVSGEKEKIFTEYQYAIKPGVYKTFESSAFNLKIEGEKRFCVIARDVTERRKAEQKLKESEEKYKALFDSSPYSVILSDMSGNIIDCNANVEKVFGLKNDDVIGKNFRDFALYPSESLPLLIKNFKILLKGEIPEPFEIQIYRKDRSLIWINSQSYFVKIGDETFIHSIVQDITAIKEAEQKIKESEEKFSLIFESAADAVLWADAESGEIIDCNNALEILLEKNKDEILGKHVTTLNPPEELEQNRERFENSIKEGKFSTRETNLISKTGKYIPVLVTGSIASIGGIKINMVIFHDITNRKQADQKLKESEEKFRKIIENSNEGYFEVDLKGSYTFFNDAFYEILRYPRNELLGLNYKSYMSEKNSKRTFKVFNSVYNTGIPHKSYQYARRKDGKEIYTESSIYLRHDTDGNKIGFGGFLRDITEKRKADQKLKESEEKFRKIIENSKEGYFEVDLKGNFTFFNDAFCELLRYPRNELLGLNYKIYMSQKNSEKTLKVFNDVFNTGIPHKSFEYEIIRKDGKKLYGESSVYLRYDTDANKIGFSGFLRDITEKREAEQRLIESGKMYREAFARADFFKDLIAHDINNILQNIKLSTELSSLYLNKPDKLNELTEIFEITSNQVNRGAKLISNIIKLTAIENKVKIFDAAETHKILEEAIKSVKNSFQSKNINIQIDSIDKTVLLKANDLLLYLFENILTNAIKYNDRNNVEVLVRFSKFNENGTDFVKVEFIDNGIGIPDDKKIIIFQKGFQKDKGGRGMGLGLSLVKKIIKSYNGQIWVEDKVKGDYTKGSNFIILIPEMQKDK